MKWEYKIVDLPSASPDWQHETQECLNIQGSYGWEVIAIVPHALAPNRIVAYMRREYVPGWAEK